LALSPDAAKKNDFDLVMSTLGEVDFGRPGIQYVHYPDELDRKTPAQRDGQPVWNQWTRLREQVRPWRVISGISFPRIKLNVTLVNSDSTGEAVRALRHPDTDDLSAGSG